MSYTDPILNKIRDVLNEFGPKDLRKKYFLGDPLNIDPKILPACFISYDRQRISDADNQHLESKLPVVLNVVYDMRKDLNKALDNINGHMSVVEMITGRDDNFAIRKDSIVGALRMHQDLAPNLWIDVGTETEADYGTGVGKRGPGIFSTEGILRIQVIHHQLKPELTS